MGPHLFTTVLLYRHTRLWSKPVRAAPLLAVAVRAALQGGAGGRGDAVGAAAELEGVAPATGELAGPGGRSALFGDQQVAVNVGYSCHQIPKLKIRDAALIYSY